MISVAFGYFVGNGSYDGPFIWCGFKPRWIVLRDLNNPCSWWLLDTARHRGHSTASLLFPDLVQNEYLNPDNVEIDILANGFKIRNANTANSVYAGSIFLAFAENPLKYSRPMVGQP